ncbi:hypothetical protein JOD63_002286 [Microbacterium terrae]|uniref:DUF58 domain-containing protein n=1 Tax=Microbacterium terrae TaxID=69369 RepID=A0A0M2H5V9_9MICO|nr:DUF58 domain-containing protein [Microbacterium terrae]KJL39394.1 hypothetical protein RS81_02024 [Microbacterium terrae]MBP1078318.1 hypothetical protein [Microbacterium terrae]GLJ97797.1 hypothetical protein GCM10017594_09940 [Microbacterium terrae]
MSLTESRLTRTSQSTGTAGRTHVTSTSVTSARRGRAVVSAAVWATRAWRAAGSGIREAATWTARTVRPPGVLVAAAATVGLVLGIVFGWVEWMVAGTASLVLLVAAVPFLFGARSYDVDLSLAHERVVAGDGIVGEIVVRNHGHRATLPGRIDIPVGAGLVEFGVPLLRPGHTIAQPLDIPGLRRGVISVGPATTVRSDPVGLLRRENSFEDVHEVFVHPRTVTIPSTSAGLIRDLEGGPTRRLVDSDMSFHAIREYAPGDSRRQIHWRSTAKTGRLMVRQYEESRRSRMAVVLAVAENEYADADEFELAVSSAASLGLRAVRDARDVQIAAGSEIPRVVRGRLRAIRHIPATAPRPMLDGFSGIDLLESTMPVRDVCRLVSESGERLSIAFVVVGSQVTLGRLQQAALAFPADTAVVGVICDERAHPRMQTLSGLTVLTVGTLDDLAGLLLRGATS